MTRSHVGLGLLAVSVLAAVLGVACQDQRHDAFEVHQSDCVACHTVEYDATSMPPHEGLFDRLCGNCHTTDAWVPAVAVVHDWFPLANLHVVGTDGVEVACTECHTTGFQPGQTPNQCVGCHQANYDMTTRPPHVGNLPTDCAQCHTDAGWVPSSFVHPWVLDGAHLATPCADCHGEPPVYEGTPRDCVGCHRDDYDASPYPNHSTFPTTCEGCHTTTAWTPALEGAHPTDRFPINDKHDYACLDCHNPDLGASTDGMNADCVGCHEGEHTRARMDEKHREERDYPTGPAPPNFCLDCHPDGRN